MFQLMFAIITPGLVVGAIAERMRFASYVIFTVLFSLLVYAPLAHMSWHPEGLLFKMGALDFAGGTNRAQMANDASTRNGSADLSVIFFMVYFLVKQDLFKMNKQWQTICL